MYDGVPFKLDAHLDRLAASAERLRLPAPPHDALAALARDAIDAGGLPDATLRFLWTAGREGGGAPAGLALVSTLPPDLDALRARGLRLAVIALGARRARRREVDELRREHGGAGRSGARRSRRCAARRSPDGTVLEAPTSNVWFREGDRLLTPSLALAAPRGRHARDARRARARPRLRGRGGRLRARPAPRRRRGLSLVFGARGDAGRRGRRRARRARPGRCSPPGRSADGCGLP